MDPARRAAQAPKRDPHGRRARDEPRPRDRSLRARAGDPYGSRARRSATRRARRTPARADRALGRTRLSHARHAQDDRRAAADLRREYGLAAAAAALLPHGRRVLAARCARLRRRGARARGADRARGAARALARGGRTRLGRDRGGARARPCAGRDSTRAWSRSRSTTAPRSAPAASHGSPSVSRRLLERRRRAPAAPSGLGRRSRGRDALARRRLRPPHRRRPSTRSSSPARRGSRSSPCTRARRWPRCWRYASAASSATARCSTGTRTTRLLRPVSRLRAS